MSEFKAAVDNASPLVRMFNVTCSTGDQPPVTPKKTLLEATGYKGPQVKTSTNLTSKSVASSTVGANATAQSHKVDLTSAANDARDVKAAITTHLADIKSTIAEASKGVDGFDNNIFADERMGNGTGIGMVASAAVGGFAGSGTLAKVVSHSGAIADAAQGMKSGAKNKADLLAKLEDHMRVLAKSEAANTAGQGSDSEGASAPKTPLQDVVNALDSGYGLEEIMLMDYKQLPEYQLADTMEQNAMDMLDLADRVQDETAHKAGATRHTEEAIDLDKASGLGMAMNDIDAGDVGLTTASIAGITKFPPLQDDFLQVAGMNPQPELVAKLEKALEEKPTQAPEPPPPPPVNAAIGGMGGGIGA